MSQEVLSRMKDNLYMFGEINGKWAFSLVMTVAKDGTASGWYYYDSRQQRIKLDGDLRGHSLVLTKNGERQER